ncbi:hypothetical protein WJX81_003657 [Elliptochloris bilobata]|uniref:Uncharacterized protein n=1 Tax=Elliptochloris bilobata TaxID=381761 RepID=A0AAW1R2K0_9CHLO
MVVTSAVAHPVLQEELEPAAALLQARMAGPLLKSTQALARFTYFFYFHSIPPIILGVAFLALKRDYLFKNRVFDYNTPEALHWTRPEPCTEYCDSCNPMEVRFRTFDGHCNSLNPNLTGMGMSNHRFSHSALYPENASVPGLWEPNPYDVAEKLLKTPEGKERATAPDFSMFLSLWINLQLHDWSFHEVSNDSSWKLQYGPGKDDTFVLRKSYFDEGGHCINTETPWWDCGQIYGTTAERAGSLRLDGGGCEMRLDRDGLMPLGSDGLPESGMVKNWWAGVESMHLLFVKEHNYLCEQLRKENSTFNEEELYQTARLIVAALNGHIHTMEWTPALLNNEVLNTTLRGNWDGLTQAFIDHEMNSLKHSYVPVEITKAIGKLIEKSAPYTKGVGHVTDISGVPYSFPEDHTSAYRMHPLLPDQYTFAGDKVEASNMVNQHARDVIKKYGISAMLDAFGHQAPTTLTIHNYPDFLTKVDIPGAGLSCFLRPFPVCSSPA